MKRIMKPRAAALALAAPLLFTAPALADSGKSSKNVRGTVSIQTGNGGLYLNITSSPASGSTFVPMALAKKFSVVPVYLTPVQAQQLCTAFGGTLAEPQTYQEMLDITAAARLHFPSIHIYRIKSLLVHLNLEHI